MTSHPSDEDIQQFAMDRSRCTADLHVHVEICAVCRQAVETYQLLFSVIKEEPAPVFDFDLPAVVMPQLADSREFVKADRFVSAFLVLFIGCCLTAPVWAFRKYILNVFGDISPFFIYAILGSAAIILSLTLLNMYKKFRRQMRLLNFH